MRSGPFCPHQDNGGHGEGQDRCDYVQPAEDAHVAEDESKLAGDNPQADVHDDPLSPMGGVANVAANAAS